MLDLLIKQFVTPERVSELQKKIEQEYNAIELQPGELRPFYTLVVNDSGLVVNLITLKSKDDIIVYSRLIKSFKIDEIITELINKK